MESGAGVCSSFERVYFLIICVMEMLGVVNP